MSDPNLNTIVMLGQQGSTKYMLFDSNKTPILNQVYYPTAENNKRSISYSNGRVLCTDKDFNIYYGDLASTPSQQFVWTQIQGGASQVSLDGFTMEAVVINDATDIYYTSDPTTGEWSGIIPPDNVYMNYVTISNNQIVTTDTTGGIWYYSSEKWLKIPNTVPVLQNLLMGEVQYAPLSFDGYNMNISYISSTDQSIYTSTIRANLFIDPKWVQVNATNKYISVAYSKSRIFASASIGTTNVLFYFSTSGANQTPVAIGSGTSSANARIISIQQSNSRILRPPFLNIGGNAYLYSGENMTSPSSTYYSVMNQQGNLTIHNAGNNSIIWNSGTSVPNSYAMFTSEGYLSIMGPDNKIIWKNPAYTASNQNPFLYLDDNGVLTIVDNATPFPTVMWSTAGTATPQKQGSTNGPQKTVPQTTVPQTTAPQTAAPLMTARQTTQPYCPLPTEIFNCLLKQSDLNAAFNSKSDAATNDYWSTKGSTPCLRANSWYNTYPSDYRRIECASAGSTTAPYATTKGPTTMTNGMLTSASQTTVPLTTVPLTTVPLTTYPQTTARITAAPLMTTPYATTKGPTTMTNGMLTSAPQTTSPQTTARITTAPLTTAPLTTAPLTTYPQTTARPTTARPTTAPLTTTPYATTKGIMAGSTVKRGLNIGSAIDTTETPIISTISNTQTPYSTTATTNPYVNMTTKNPVIIPTSTKGAYGGNITTPAKPIITTKPTLTMDGFKKNVEKYVASLKNKKDKKMHSEGYKLLYNKKYRFLSVEDMEREFTKKISENKNKIKKQPKKADQYRKDNENIRKDIKAIESNTDVYMQFQAFIEQVDEIRYPQDVTNANPSNNDISEIFGNLGNNISNPFGNLSNPFLNIF